MPKGKAPSKSQYWACELYPESCPNWRGALAALLLPTAAVLHDCDVNPETGELKKPHVHVILEWSGPTTERNALACVDGLPIAGGKVIRIKSFVGYCRYLLHLDQPDKYQYPEDSFECFCGGKYSLSLPLTPEESAAVHEDVRAWIVSTRCTELCDLVVYAMESHPEWLADIDRYNALWDRLIKSQRGKARSAYLAQCQSV